VSKKTHTGRLSVEMAAGDLRHQVTIQQSVEAPDTFGGAGTPTTWTTYAVVWAAIEPGSAREFIEAQQQSAEKTVTIRIRYLAGVTPKMRVLYQDPDRGQRLFDIQGVIDIDERRRHMHLISIERNVG
jgi:SPP1 family predicted phage head-tail adaptor